jgi:outer membrane lipoprotein-sorting protein
MGRSRCRLVILAFAVLLPRIICRAAGPSTLPAAAPPGIDTPLWERMKEIDGKVGRISDLTASFEQQKFTALLKRPLVSRGTVTAKGAAMLWDTRAPEPTVMRVDAKEVTLFYPKQKVVEVYPLAGQLSAVAASPLPRLAVLLEHFRFSPAPTTDLGQPHEPGLLAFRLVPVDEAIREHVDNVTVLIDANRGFIRSFQLIDTDGERTLIHFKDVKINSGIEDARLELRIPAGVKTVRPLENFGPTPGPATRPARSEGPHRE